VIGVTLSAGVRNWCPVAWAMASRTIWLLAVSSLN